MTIETYIEPKVTRNLEAVRVTVSLAEFKLDDIATYLRENGYEVNGTYSRALLENIRSQRSEYCASCHDDDAESGLFIEDAQLARVRTLALCGQNESAREFVMQIVSDYLGRKV